MGAKIGLEAKLYYNTGSNGSPTWVEVTLARDVSAKASKSRGNVSKRGGGGFETERGTLIKLGIPFDIVTDPSHANYVFLQARFLDRAAVQFACVNGDITVSGTTGWKGYCEVFDFEDKQPLNGESLTSVEIGLTDPGSNPNPTWITI